jgi:hypothetical protein
LNRLSIRIGRRITVGIERRLKVPDERHLTALEGRKNGLVSTGKAPDNLIRASRVFEQHDRKRQAE